MEFYFNESIVDDFKWYIEKLLTHRNPYTNLTYAEDPTIFAFESGNELYGHVRGDTNCPASWIQDICRFVKTLAPKKLFVDGTYGINATHLEIEEVDIFSDHFYPLNITRLQHGMDMVATVNKPYFAGEYDWTGLYGGDALPDFYEAMRSHKAWGGDAFWSLFGRNVPNCQVRSSCIALLSPR